MKCPLLGRYGWYKGQKPDFYMGDCLKEECAWWDGAFETCAVLSVEADFKAISTFLDEICQKMPHAGLFTK